MAYNPIAKIHSRTIDIKSQSNLNTWEYILLREGDRKSAVVYCKRLIKRLRIAGALHRSVHIYVIIDG